MRSWPLVDAPFSTIGADPALSMAEQSKLAASKSRRVTFEQNMVIARHVLKHEGPFVLILRTLEYVWRQLTGR